MGRHPKYEASSKYEAQRQSYLAWKEKYGQHVECQYCHKMIKQCFLTGHQRKSKKCLMKQEIEALKNQHGEQTNIAVDSDHNREVTA